MRNKMSRQFMLFLAGQGILSLGDSIRFIAVTVLMYRISGSGIAAAAGVALSALPGIIASPFAGVLGDRTRETRVLVLVDIARFLAAPLFLAAGKMAQIYMLLVMMSVFDVFYGPSKRKYVLYMTGKEGAVRANSYLTGAAGASYLAGPLLSGLLADNFGPPPAIAISGICCLISGIMTIISAASGTAAAGGRGSGKRTAAIRESGTEDFREALRYCLLTPVMRELLAANAVAGFCAISVNLAFYPYAFDALKVTAKEWSLLITIYNGTNLSAMFVAGRIEKRLEKNGEALFYISFAAVAAAYILYAFAKEYVQVLVLQLTEGTLAALCGIMLAARFQAFTDRRCVARAACIGDMLASAGKLAGMGCTALITAKFSIREVFVFNGIILLVFALSGLARPAAAAFS